MSAPLLAQASFLQARMLACANGDGLDRYALHGMCRVRGLDEPSVVAAALESLSRRHEVLRTRLVDHDGEILQEVLASAPPSFSVLSFGEPPPGRRARLVRHLVRKAIREPFDLRRAPWLRATLARVGPHESLLLISTSHAAADAYGWTVLLRELTCSISGESDAAASSPAPLQFRRYAEQERAAAPGRATRPRWLTPLEHRMPRDPFGTASMSAGSVRERSVGLAALPPAIVRRLERVAADRLATLPMAVLALFLAALVRAGASRDLLVGAFDVNRQMAGSDFAVGCFVSLVLIRVRLHPDMAFAAVVEVVRDRFLESLDESVPLERQAASLPACGEDLLTRRLCDVLFNYQAYFGHDIASPDKRSRPTIAPGPLLQAPVATARAPWAGASLGLTVRGSDAGALEGWLPFDENVCARKQIARVTLQWRTLARRIAAHPERPLGRL